MRNNKDRFSWMWFLNWIFQFNYQTPINTALLDKQIRELHELIAELTGRIPTKMHSMQKTMLSSFDNTSDWSKENHSILQPHIPDHEVDQKLYF